MKDDTCPLCKNPILDGDCVLSRQGLTFHAGCGQVSMAWPVVLESLHQRIAALEANSGKHEVIIGSGLEPDAKPQPVADDAAVGDSPHRMRMYASALSYNGSKAESGGKHLLLWGASKIDAQTKENAALRAELAAERERREKAESEVRHQDAMVSEYNTKANAARERCAVLEGLLREVAAFPRGINAPGKAILDRIDAALAGKDGGK